MTRNSRSSRDRQHHVEHADRRAHRPHSADLAVRIQGADSRGAGFDELVRSANVSEGGLALLTQRDLSHSATLIVSIAGAGGPRAGGGRADFRAQAIVAYVLPEGDHNRVGLRFVGATLTP